MPSSISHARPRGRQDAVRRVIRRFATLVVALSVLALAAALAAGSALANEYTGMLQSGTLSMANPGTSITGWAGYSSSTIDPVSANANFADDSWVAPGGTQFVGFAYTAAWFESQALDSTGALSIGFVGSGGSAPADLDFPWTDDCSVTEQDSPREWVRNGAEAGASYSPTCSTNGNVSGWNYTNVETESLAPSVNPQVSYSTLSLRGWCARDNTCSGDDIAAAQVVNLSAEVDDPDNQPTGGASWTTTINSNDWYQTDTGAPTLQASANDPAGVCAIGLQFTGPGSYYDQVSDVAPATENPGAPIGTEFDSVQPCGTGNAGGSGAMPGNIASGTYNVAVVASDPGNWQSGNGLDNAPTVANYSSAINIDDTVPAVSWASTTGGWTSSSSRDLDVTVGPSGLGSVTCTDNGANVAATLVSGSRTGAGTTAWSVPTATSGANAVSCSATNGDANGGLTATKAATFDVDTTVPVVSFADPGYMAGMWTNDSQTVTSRRSRRPERGGVVVVHLGWRIGATRWLWLRPKRQSPVTADICSTARPSQRRA